METLRYCLRKILYGIPLIIGVTFISFLLMVYFGPDKTYDLLGKNPTVDQITEIRKELGYDKPFPVRYVSYLYELFTFNFGHSESTGEKVSSIFKRTIPVSFALSLPGFILGNLIALVLALFSSYYRGRWQDKIIMICSVIGMSISFLIVIIIFQIIFCSSYGLNLFPSQGWRAENLSEYISYVTVPTLAMIFVGLGYNTRFYRAIIVEESSKEYVRTARAYGFHPIKIMFKYVLKNCMIPIVTRIIFTIPFIIIGGSILLERFFGIPGIGLIAYNAIASGDQPVIKALIGITSVLYVLVLTGADILYKIFDSRINLK